MTNVIVVDSLVRRIPLPGVSPTIAVADATAGMTT